MRGMKSAMEKGKVTLGVSPLRWCSLRGWLGEEMMLAFKGAAIIRAWDPDSKTWFYPENFDVLVRSVLGLPVGLAPEIKLEPRPRQGEIKHRIAWAKAKGVSPLDPAFRDSEMEPHWLDSDPYAVLMIDEDAPWGLVESAYNYWKYTLSPKNMGVGGIDEPLQRIEEAYAAIKEERTAPSFDEEVEKYAEETP